MVNILPYSREAPCSPIFMKLGTQSEVADVITYKEFLVNWSIAYGVLTPTKLPFSSLKPRRPYNSVALPCYTVMKKASISTARMFELWTSV